MNNLTADFIFTVLHVNPSAYAVISGSSKYPDIHGIILFNKMKNGTLITAEVTGLPQQNPKCNGGFFGFHIHSGSSCTGNADDQFANAGSHYNPENCEHPFHAGDLPALLSSNGTAWSAFFTDRFMPEEIIGKTVIVHEMPDDYHTQPSGNSGAKIACGVILKS